MDHETPDVIEAQMVETRQSLTDKVAALEDSVVGTVQSATTAVADTVRTVKDAVGDTIDAVKDNVASALDVGHHVRENPWASVGTAAVAGVFAGLLIFRRAPSGGATARPAPRLVPEPLATTAAPRGGGMGMFDALLGRIGDEVKKLGESVIERVSSEFHRAVDESVPRLVDRMTFAAPTGDRTANEEAASKFRLNGMVSPNCRAS